MRFLVIGSGGREHAIAWRLLNDGSAKEVYVAPGNGGIDEEYRVNISIDDFEAIADFCDNKNIDMVVVGPEAPLVGGLVDFLEKKGMAVFGPSAKAAQLEGSKLFAKMIMEKYDIPTAGHRDFSGKKDLLEYIETVETYPVVIKLDGLAAGKGVGIPENRQEAIEFIEANVGDDTKVFAEDFIDGEEVSILGISDGENILTFVASQDHKRIFDGDKGPNTGGMGAYAPAPVATDDILKLVHDQVLEPTVQGMKKEGIPYKGILYAGIIISKDRIYVLEYNARFGDPETQVVLPLLDGKLGDLFKASAAGDLSSVDMAFKKQHAISVVLSSGGYPGRYEKGKIISGLEKTEKDVIVFHAGTKSEGGKCLTNGGRVLNVTALGNSLSEAREKAYQAIESIEFEGMFFRKDIAHRALDQG